MHYFKSTLQKVHFRNIHIKIQLVNYVLIKNSLVLIKFGEFKERFKGEV